MDAGLETVTKSAKDNLRPIALLNTDYKILLWAIFVRAEGRHEDFIVRICKNNNNNNDIRLVFERLYYSKIIQERVYFYF